MPSDVAGSLRRPYSAFLAVLVTGVVLIIAGGGTSPYTAVCLDGLFGVAGLISAYALAPTAAPVVKP